MQRTLLGSLALALLLGLPAARARGEDPGAEATRLLTEYLRIDTTNPPGRELEGARFLRDVLASEGVEARVLDLGDGRANLVARWRGAVPGAPGVALLHHIDVVPADPSRWSAPPFEGRVIGHHLYGRGALDIKGKGIVDLVTFLGLVRRRERLAGDVVYLAVADEEEGGLGSRAMVGKHRGHLEGVRYVLDEGMSPRADASGRTVAYLVAVGEKVPVWLKVSFEGESGHGSLPRRGTAPQRAIQAAARVLRHPWPYEVRPEVMGQLRLYLAGRDLTDLPGWRGSLERSLGVRTFVHALADDPELGALLGNTLSLTRLAGSDKVNTIPNRASFGLDCRLLPGVDVDGFLSELAAVIRDPGARIEVVFTQPGTPPSPTDTALWRALEGAAAARDPGVPVMPALLTASTDSSFYRTAGFVTYGFEPYPLGKEEYELAHGNDERIDVRRLGPAVALLTDVLRRVNEGAKR